MEVATIKKDSVVQQYPWNDKYKVLLDDISERDYPNKHYFNKDVLCLDVDRYEADHAGDNDKTVDTVMGIADYNTTTMTCSKERLRMVELRMGYRNPYNLKVSDLSSKISHTAQMFNGSPIDKFAIFVFEEKEAPIVRNLFNRWGRERKEAKNWRAITPNAFCESIKTEKDFPYTPSHDIDGVKNAISGVKSSSQLARTLEYWTREILKEYSQYRLAEAEAIKDTIIMALGSVNLNDFDDASEYSELINLYIEDFKKIATV